METPKTPHNPGTIERFNLWLNGSVTVRIFSVTILVLLLMIPNAMIQDIIRERQFTSNDAVREVSAKWGYDQTVAGPVISVPYLTFKEDKDGKKFFNHKKLFDITKKVTRNLDTVIDRNYYPVKEAENSNFRHRPVGLGIQGLADAFIMLRMPFTSDEAKKLNQEIFETLYFAAVTSSMEMAKTRGKYSTFEGSPMSEGEFQFNMWNISEDELSGRWDWKKLRKNVVKHGVRNSLLVAPMPTASTSQILGNNEAFEPYTSNMFTRRTLSGEFVVVNKHLLRDLNDLGIWNDNLKNKLIAANGSVQNIDEIPENLKELYRTAWEISQKDIIEMAADRGAYIDQSQSLNIFMENANFAKLTSMHFYGWEKGLKTGMYYLRTKAARDAIQFTVDKTTLEQPKAEEVQMEAPPTSNAEEYAAYLRAQREKVEEGDDCEMCSG